MIDLSKPSDCLPYDLAVAKLEANCHVKKCLQLIRDYLSYHKEKTKIGSDFNWACAIRVVPRIGSILGALFFNNFINNINNIFHVVENSDICNFVGENTLNFHHSNLPLILKHE